MDNPDEILDGREAIDILNELEILGQQAKDACTKAAELGLRLTQLLGPEQTGTEMKKRGIVIPTFVSLDENSLIIPSPLRPPPGPPIVVLKEGEVRRKEVV